MRGDAFVKATLAGARIVVCVGCGGTGKTTIAAALGPDEFPDLVRRDSHGS